MGGPSAVVATCFSRRCYRSPCCLWPPPHRPGISWSTASPPSRRRSNRSAPCGKRAPARASTSSSRRRNLSYAQIDRGARCDLIFALAGAATEEAARAKIIQGATITRALRNGLVLVGTESAAGPIDGANVADISRLIAGKRLAIANPDRDPAGARALELLRKIGIADDDNRDVAVAESSAGVVNLLATNKARLGIVYSTDATAGFKLAGAAAGAGPAADRICRCASPRSAIGYPTVHGVCQVGGGASGIQIGGTCADRRCASGGRRQ